MELTEYTRTADTPAAAANPKVLLVLPWSPDHPGGVSVVVRNLKRELAMGGLSPVIAIDDWEARTPTTDKDCNLRFRFRVGGGNGWTALAKAIVAAPTRMRVTHRLLREVRAVNFHYPSTNALGVALLKRLGLFKGHLVLSFHGTDVRAPATRGERLAWRLLLDAADSVTACSIALAERVCATYGLPRDRVSIIRNGVSAATFSPEAAARPSTTLPTRYIASIGGYIPLKGHKLLVRAFARIAPTYPDVCLVIAGMEGPERPKLLELANELGVDHRLQCLVGLAPNAVAATLARAQACVQPSKQESFPLAVLEAGACGTPVIASAVGGHVEMLDHGVTGYLFPPEDVEACARAIETVLADRASAVAVGRKFNEEVVARYTWTASAAGYASAMGVAIADRAEAHITPQR